MKNRLFCLLITCFFMLGNTAFSSYLGVGIADILIGKSGDVVCSFTVPDKYLDKGELIVPIEITAINNGKQPVYTGYSNDLKVLLPTHLTGDFLLELRIGNHCFTEKIHL